MEQKTEFQLIFPAVKEWRQQQGRFPQDQFEFPLEILKKYRFLFDYFAIPCTGSGTKVLFEDRSNLGEEEYLIDVHPKSVHISYATPRGCFYALSTFLQILALFGRESVGKDRPCFLIRDYPDLRFRGFHLDISRGAVPRLETLRNLMIRAGLLKFNHIGLYIEDTLQFDSPMGPVAKKSMITPAEIRELNRLARSMGIELFPSIQVLCHLRNWLQQSGHRELTSSRSDDCIDPKRDEAVEEVFRHAEAISDHFPAKLLHIGMDECSALDSAEDYFTHFRKSLFRFQKRGKRVGFWGDMFVHYPELIRKIPADVLVFNWEYFIEREEEFEKQAALFKKHHLPQVLCPATWSWAKLVPAPQKAYRNIDAAFQAARKLSLEGVMLTSWGDDGNEYLLEGIDLCLFYTGNLLWSGKPSNPDSFHAWKRCREGEELFRIYTFIAKVDQPLPYTHRYYLWEDPIYAPYSRQRQPDEIVSHITKAHDYLVKRIGREDGPGSYLAFVRDLYAVIAAKVEFSRLLPIMAEQDHLDWIEQTCRELIARLETLKLNYSRLWLREYKPEGLFYNQMKFAHIQERLRFLVQLKGDPEAWRAIVDRLHSDLNDQPLPTVHFPKLFGQ